MLCRPKKNSVLALYISVTDQAVTSVLVQQCKDGQRPIYFVNKVLHGAEARYLILEKAALAVVVTARRLRHYFQNHIVKTMTDLPIKAVLQEHDISGRQVK